MRPFAIWSLTGLWWLLAFGAGHIVPTSPLFSPSYPLLEKALAGNPQAMEEQIQTWALPDALREEILFLAKQNDPQGKKVIAQSVAAAEMLLALLPVEHIIAAPRGQSTAIQHFVDSSRQEAIWQKGPELAVVSTYSNPATVASYQRQGIEVFRLKTPTTLEDIADEVEQLGKAVGCPNRGRLMACFLRAQHLQFKALVKDKKAAYLSHAINYAQVGREHLMGRALADLGVVESAPGWQTELSLERLFKKNFDHLIFSSPYGKACRDTRIQNLPKHSVDGKCQSSFSQWIFYAVAQALGGL